MRPLTLHTSILRDMHVLAVPMAFMHMLQHNIVGHKTARLVKMPHIQQISTSTRSDTSRLMPVEQLLIECDAQIKCQQPSTRSSSHCDRCKNRIIVRTQTFGRLPNLTSPLCCCSSRPQTRVAKGKAAEQTRLPYRHSKVQLRGPVLMCAFVLIISDDLDIKAHASTGLALSSVAGGRSAIVCLGLWRVADPAKVYNLNAAHGTATGCPF